MMGSAKMLANDGVKAESYGRPAAGLDAVSTRLMTGSRVVFMLNERGAQQVQPLVTTGRSSGGRS